MASIEMKNLRSFPMEKLCFDLKLEALERMEPRDMYELAKVNQGFQRMLVRVPSIVFGEHVSWIEFDNEQIRIKKFSKSNKMELNDYCAFSHFSFVKKIRSCDLLWFDQLHKIFWMPHRLNEKYTLLKNLKSVNELLLAWDDKEEILERFFSNFHASIKKEVVLDICWTAFKDQVIKDRIENFMVAPQLKDCEKIVFHCYSEGSVRFCYNALLKAEIKNVVMYTDTSGCIDLIIQKIITNGIPNKNPEAAIFLYSNGCYFTMDHSKYPGMRRIDGEDRLRVLKEANVLVRNFGYSGSHGSNYFEEGFEESSMFRRRFDSTRDYICVFDERYEDRFLAFYVPVD